MCSATGHLSWAWCEFSHQALTSSRATGFSFQSMAQNSQEPPLHCIVFYSEAAKIPPHWDFQQGLDNCQVFTVPSIQFTVLPTLTFPFHCFVHMPHVPSFPFPFSPVIWGDIGSCSFLFPAIYSLVITELSLSALLLEHSPQCWPWKPQLIIPHTKQLLWD